MKASGKALWHQVHVEYELEEHEAGLLLTMCRTRDRLDDLAAIVSREDVIESGTGRVHPALVEHRQQAIAYARLSAALRLPAGDENDPAAKRCPAVWRRSSPVQVRGRVVRRRVPPAGPAKGLRAAMAAENREQAARHRDPLLVNHWLAEAER